MGYKLAGCRVVLANDIDPLMAAHYRRNLPGTPVAVCPIKDIPDSRIPDNVDILDGSPPCSTFSMSGNRESDWGVSKKFTEGQAKQVLSDLFFDYLDLADRIRPKVLIAENVTGILLGNAKLYSKRIMERMRELGYRPQVFSINAADCGVPQLRQRVFFCAVRDDVSSAKLVLNPRARHISTGEACADVQVATEEDAIEDSLVAEATHQRFWAKARKGQSYRNVASRTVGKVSWFNFIRLDDRKPAPTLAASSHNYAHWSELRLLNCMEWRRLGSFPDDYAANRPHTLKYLIGMSVPPRMMQYVASEVRKQWLA
jgi:DNA (cytosine-5)-methyltransferase 1